ncbi:MAG: 4'-phosphopantetheinyl transferase superfamily protein [Proteobacteria bacterium]|nr:4'-phosphopantetheinyl transferase superfamily protein [Pseudomonadota bacterium]
MFPMYAEALGSKDFAGKEPRIVFFDADDGWLKGHPSLCEKEIHLWRTYLNKKDYSREMRILSESERTKAEHFYFEKDRRSFIITHAMLRKILGGYLKTDPRNVEFIYGIYGKPSVVVDHNKISFNMSGSFEVSVFAFACGRQVGVDVEYIRPMDDVQSIVSNFFSPGEKSAFEAVEENQRLKAFFNCWTRKEAYLKALGKGLRQPLDSFEVSLGPGTAPRLIWVRDNAQEVFKWSIRSFIPEPGYVGALVFKRDVG